MMKRFVLASLLSAVMSLSAQADVITQWTFEGDVLTPSTGSGTAAYVGGTAAASSGEFAAGNPGRGWNTSSYPTQGTASGTAGVSFLASTLGYQNIQISFDHRASGTASRWAQLDLTFDGGTTWTAGVWNNGGGLSPHDNFYSFGSIDLTSYAAANDNPNFGFRIVSIFSPQAFNQNSSVSHLANEAYMRANAGATYPPTAGTGGATSLYGATGTWRFDNVTIEGAAVPEPTSMVLLTVAGLGGLLVRVRRK